MEISTTHSKRLLHPMFARFCRIATAIAFALILICAFGVGSIRADDRHGHDGGDHGRGHDDHDRGYRGPQVYYAPQPDYYYAPPPNYYSQPDPYEYYPPPQPGYYPPPPSEGINLFFGL